MKDIYDDIYNILEAPKANFHIIIILIRDSLDTMTYCL